MYVAPAYVNDEKRIAVLNAIKDALDKKECIRIPATVVGFAGKDEDTGELNKAVLLNIANLGIIGFVRRAHWSVTVTTSLSHNVAVGDVIEVIIMGISQWSKKNKRPIFDCSRKLVMELDGIDPWKGIGEKITRNTKVELTCVEKRERNFFSIIDGLKDLEVLCEYPDDITINVGSKYRGYIYRVSEESKRLCARIEAAVE